MGSSDLKFDALALEGLLRKKGDYAHVSVRSRAGHLHVEVEEAEGVRSAVARATPIGRSQYGLSFRTHAGKWEPMPVSGSLQEITEGLVELLGPYLDRPKL